MKSLTLIIIGNLQQIIIGRPHTKYQYHNHCAGCCLWYPKEMGGRCPECGYLARTKARTK